MQSLPSPLRRLLIFEIEFYFPMPCRFTLLLPLPWNNLRIRERIPEGQLCNLFGCHRLLSLIVSYIAPFLLNCHSGNGICRGPAALRGPTRNSFTSSTVENFHLLSPVNLFAPLSAPSGMIFWNFRQNVRDHAEFIQSPGHGGAMSRPGRPRHASPPC